MDHSILKKRLNTFKSGKKGILRKVSDDVVIDVLRAWESWPGTTKDLYRELGMSKMQMVVMIKKAKQLVKSGAVAESEFKEIKVEGALEESVGCLSPITLRWEKGRVIRFGQVDQLVEFLKKVS